MQKKFLKCIFSVLLSLTLLLSSTTTSFANNTNSSTSTISHKTIIADNNKRSVDWSDNPFYGTKSTDYNKYVGTRSRSQKLDSLITTITAATLTIVIAKIIGIGGTTAKDVANGILGSVVSLSVSSGSNLYYTEIIYENKNNPFQQEHIFRFYVDKKHTQFLYSTISYSQTTPLS